MKRRFGSKITLGIALVSLLIVSAQAAPPPDSPTVDGKFDTPNEYGDMPEVVDALYGTFVLKWIEDEGLYFLYDGWDPPSPLVDSEQLLWTNPVDTVAKNWKFDFTFLVNEWSWHFDECSASWSTAASPDNYFTLDPATWNVSSGYNTSPYDEDTQHNTYEVFIPRETIPEPGTIVLLSLGRLTLLKRRRT